MPYIPTWPSNTVRMVVTFVSLCLAANALARDRVLYSFTGGADGGEPQTGLVADSAGNFYGVSSGGELQAIQCQASNGCGVVFKLSHDAGGWAETVLHTFTGGADGLRPLGGLIFDKAGNLYGTTSEGGTGCAGLYGCGTVYELSPNGDGTWEEKILYNFAAGSDAEDPEAGLIFDAAGNLYGTARFGVNAGCNTLGCGAVFELTPNTDGTWSEQILYVFQDGADGAEPAAALVFDGAGNLYGTAGIGGDLTCNPPYGCGVIYKLSPSPAGWTESVLYSFECRVDACFPNTSLTADTAGNLVGSMRGGGPNGYGYLYRLIPQTGGTYRFSSFYSFDFQHGGGPMGTLLLWGGSLYGTASYGGKTSHLCNNGCGGVFRLTPASDGVHYSFLNFGIAAKGAGPSAGVILGANRRLFGTTNAGGANNAGTVFEAPSDF